MHTPGPWGLWMPEEGGEFAGAFQVQVNRGEYIICARNPVPHREAESRANAHLIAAAPDLFAALVAITDPHVSGDITHLYQQAHAAIRKAKGETA